MPKREVVALACMAWAGNPRERLVFGLRVSGFLRASEIGLRTSFGFSAVVARVADDLRAALAVLAPGVILLERWLRAL